MWNFIKNAMSNDNEKVDASTNEPEQQQDASVNVSASQDLPPPTRSEASLSPASRTASAAVTQSAQPEPAQPTQKDQSASEEVPPTPTKRLSIQPVLPSTVEFSLNIRKVVEKHGRTDIISPIGLFLAVAMAKAGARQKAADELSDVFDLPEDPIVAKMCMKICRDLQLNMEDKKMGVFVCNLLSAPLDLKFRPTFVAYSKKVFQFETKNLDFLNFPKHSTQEINAMVRKATQETLLTFLKKSDVVKPKLVLVNVVFFKGTWRREFHFPPANTRKEIFYNKDGTRIKVYMMVARAYFTFAEIPEFNCSAVGIPYQDIDCSFYVILPTISEGFKDLQRNMSPGFVAALRRKLDTSRPSEIPLVVKMPKFVASSQVNMVPLLQRMGVETMFLPNAHYHGYFSDNLNGCFTHFYHQAYLEIHETGSECNHTGGEILHPAVSANFNANRPFLFLVLHDKSDAIVLSGCVTHLATRENEND